MSEKSEAKEQKPSVAWLDAWYDPVANVKAFSSCITLADLASDGDYHLVIGDLEKKLKVYKGMNLVSESVLLDVPVAVCSYYMDESGTPVIAVASGPHVYVYKNLRPFYKFTLPPIQLDSKEVAVWQDLKEEKMELNQALEVLSDMKKRGIQLSYRSLDFLALDAMDQRELFIKLHKGHPLVQNTLITCMTVLKKCREEQRSAGCLVLGSESSQIFILQPSCVAIIKKIALPSVPVFIAAAGLFDVEYRIVVACRDGRIYVLKNGEMNREPIEIAVQPVGLVVTDRHVIVGGMNHTVYSYHVRGKKSWSSLMPAAITNMGLMYHEPTNTRCTLIALETGEVRIYNERNHISSIQTNDVVMGMIFGPFGREGGSLIFTFMSGCLSAKVLSRHSSLSFSGSKPPVEQDPPLKIPKKTKLYLEQAQKEKEHSTEMHRIFQRDLYKLRLMVTRNYAKIVLNNQLPQSHTQGVFIRLGAQVSGLGPVFKLKLILENTGKHIVYDTVVSFRWNTELYNFRTTLIQIGALVPSTPFECDITIDVLKDSAGAEPITVLVSGTHSPTPYITYLVNMPVSELFLDNL